MIIFVFDNFLVECIVKDDFSFLATGRTGGKGLFVKAERAEGMAAREDDRHPNLTK